MANSTGALNLNHDQKAQNENDDNDYRQSQKLSGNLTPIHRKANSSQSK